MPDPMNLALVEKHCDEILNSPYLMKQPPEELRKLRTLLMAVAVLAREDVPGLISEIKRLRNQTKQLEAHLDALHPGVPVADE